MLTLSEEKKNDEFYDNSANNSAAILISNNSKRNSNIDSNDLCNSNLGKRAFVSTELVKLKNTKMDETVAAEDSYR